MKLPVLMLCGLACACAQARDPAYVAPELLRGPQILPSAPAADSAITQAELIELRQLAAQRTPAQVEKVRADEQDETLFLFQTVLGERFNAKSLPLTAALSAKVKGDAGLAGGPAKKAFQRAHPYHLDKTLNPVCETKERADSYPSGHTLAGYWLALTLIDMVPEKRDAILARAADFAQARLICGVNFPSDLQASRLLAYSGYALMAQNPQYQRDMVAARNETRRALGLASLTQ
ncbi:phosphatase PAP2 family protein [Paucibacter sp. DJ1R-11]|uniref:phosphatase PAP2 family protein n=1 Tax=Paucibacter sp. DJ1R-11 TaxID=2893556 RepID=UPI0021E365BC|nr:phosphatase PAP2 family protein [Paucibacter sp. DJ1R-11]